MKTRLELANEYALMHMMNPKYKDVDDLEMIQWGFDYADAMLAENEKRKSKTTLTTLQQTFINGVEQPRYAPCVEEWQPDWGQAPDGYDWWAVDEWGSWWYRNEPKWDGNEWTDYQDNLVGSESEQADLFNYQGDWQDSLRKRPV